RSDSPNPRTTHDPNQFTRSEARIMDALREILAIFKVDTKPLESALKTGEKKVGAFEGTLKKLGGALAGALAGAAVVNFTRDLIATADATAKTADALGLGIVELQEWQHAAELSGVPTELLTMSVSKLGLQLHEAVTKGAGPAAEAIKALGLEAEG